MDLLQTLVSDFTSRLTAIIDQQTLERARAAVTDALGGAPSPARRGRPPKALSLTVSGRPRKKAPRQLCPAPSCRNPAAPVFGDGLRQA
jgi:hypothetical protein